jgi:hypothetical protein
MVEVFKRVIQRYKYLQKPLEENFLPDLLGYLGKWDQVARDKLAEAVALLVIELQISPRCLQSLAKDHVVKDGVALSFLTSFSKTYLAKQTGDQLGSTIRRSGLKDILSVFPPQTRDRKTLEAHFKKEGLQPVNEWYAKLALGEVKEETISNVARMVGEDEENQQVGFVIEAKLIPQIIEQLTAQQSENPVPEADLCDWIWQGLMQTVDWTARADQLDSAVVAHLTVSRIDSGM